MGAKLSKEKSEEKDAIKRFKKDLQTVNHYITEAKQSKEDMDFLEASALYMHALKVIYALMDEAELPEEIMQKLSELVVDMIKKREHLIEYQKMHDIVQKSFTHDKNWDEQQSSGTDDSDVEVQEDKRIAMRQMQFVYHHENRLKEEDELEKSNQRQLYELECKILNKHVEDEELGPDDDEPQEKSDSESYLLECA